MNIYKNLLDQQRKYTDYIEDVTSTYNRLLSEAKDKNRIIKSYLDAIAEVVSKECVCDKCHGSTYIGYGDNTEDCPACNGTGLDMNKIIYLKYVKNS